jgi:hypothetical protein
LTVGLQFANFAIDSFLTKSYSAGHRQQDMAMRAHDAVVHFLPKSAPTNEQRTLIEKQLAELKTAISELENLSKEATDPVQIQLSGFGASPPKGLPDIYSTLTGTCLLSRGTFRKGSFHASAQACP